jgi:hypothetical protein
MIHFNPDTRSFDLLLRSSDHAFQVDQADRGGEVYCASGYGLMTLGSPPDMTEHVGYSRTFYLKAVGT